MPSWQRAADEEDVSDSSQSAAELSAQIRSGDYRIDAQAVADALMRRIRGTLLGLEPVPMPGGLARGQNLSALDPGSIGPRPLRDRASARPGATRPAVAA